MWPCMIPKGTANTVWRLAGIDLAARKGVCAKNTHTHKPLCIHTRCLKERGALAAAHRFSPFCRFSVDRHTLFAGFPLSI